MPITLIDMPKPAPTLAPVRVDDFSPAFIAQTRLLINSFARTCVQLRLGGASVEAALKARGALVDWCCENRSVCLRETLTAADLRHCQLMRAYKAAHGMKLRTAPPGEEHLRSLSGMWALDEAFDEDRAAVTAILANEPTALLSRDWFEA